MRPETFQPVSIPAAIADEDASSAHGKVKYSRQTKEPLICDCPETGFGDV